MHQRTARHLILSVAAVYLLIVGGIELGRTTALLHPLTANDAIQAVTTVASLGVGCILGFYLASGQRES